MVGLPGTVHPPSVVYLLRDYPSLSQTFVRNEIIALRAGGDAVEVVALRASDPVHIPVGWGGPHRVAQRQERARGYRDSLWWLLMHPLRFLRLWQLVRACAQQERWTALYLVPTLARQLRGRPYAACHTHFAFENAYPALYLAALLGCPSSITVHASDIYRDVPATVGLLKNFDTVVTVCRFNVDLLVSHGLPASRLRVVPCGVDLPAGPPRSAVPGRRVAAVPGSVPAVGPLLVSVGRLVPKKGFGVLLRALPAVLAEVPDARLQIIGSGPQEPVLRDLLAELGLAAAVDLLGARPHADALAAIEEADVFVLACAVPPDGDSDALPVVLREAMARARPVVTTAVAGIPETIDEASGWVVPAADPAALSGALVQALTDPAAAAARGRAARERVAAQYTLARSAAELRAVFAGAGVAHGPRLRRVLGRMRGTAPQPRAAPMGRP